MYTYIYLTKLTNVLSYFVFIVTLLLLTVIKYVIVEMLQVTNDSILKHVMFANYLTILMKCFDVVVMLYLTLYMAVHTNVVTSLPSIKTWTVQQLYVFCAHQMNDCLSF